MPTVDIGPCECCGGGCCDVELPETLHVVATSAPNPACSKSFDIVWDPTPTASGWYAWKGVWLEQGEGSFFRHCLWLFARDPVGEPGAGLRIPRCSWSMPKAATAACDLGNADCGPGGPPGGPTGAPLSCSPFHVTFGVTFGAGFVQFCPCSNAANPTTITFDVTE